MDEDVLGKADTDAEVAEPVLLGTAVVALQVVAEDALVDAVSQLVVACVAVEPAVYMVVVPVDLVYEAVVLVVSAPVDLVCSAAETVVAEPEQAVEVCLAAETVVAEPVQAVAVCLVAALDEEQVLVAVAELAPVAVLALVSVPVAVSVLVAVLVSAPGPVVLVVHQNAVAYRRSLRLSQG